MKLLRLRLKGLNSIREETTLDFEHGPLSETSLFAITGPTGSGKTTLLDALSVALYHKTPRLDGSAARNPENLLSQGSREGFAEVLFEADRKRYLSEWRIRRTRGNNRLTSVKLIEADTENLLNDKKATNPVPKLLGLDFNSFRRSVLLAQGEFAAFLKANPHDKRELLESITGMEVYDQLGEILNQQRASTKNEHERLEATLANIPKSDPAEIKSTEKALKKIQKNLAVQEKAWHQARQNRETETQRLKNWQKLQETEARQKALEQQQPQMEALSAEISAARLAAELLPVQQAFEQAQNNLKELETRQENLKQICEQVQSDLETAEEEFNAQEAAFLREKKVSGEKFKQINLAVQEEIQAASLAAEAKKRIQEFETQEAEIQKNAEQLKQKKQEKQSLTHQIQEAEKFLTDNPVPDDSAARLSQLNQDVATLREHRKQLSEIEQAGRDRGKQVQELETKAENTTQTQQKIRQSCDQLIRQKQEASAALESILATGDEAFWEKRAAAVQELQEMALAFETRQKRILELKPRQLKWETEIKTSQAKQQELAEQLKTVRSAVSELENHLETLRQQEREVELTGFAAHLRTTELKPGEPCPVCGALEHPWAEQVGEKNQVLADIQTRLSQQEKELQQQQQVRQEIEQKLSALQATFAQQEQALQEVKDEIAGLQTKSEPELVRWQSVFPESEIASQLAKNELKNCEMKIKKIRSFQEQHQKLTHEFDVENGRLERLQNEAKILGEQIEQANYELKTLRDRYREIQQKIRQTEGDIQKQLPAEFASAGAGEGIRQFQAHVEKAGAAEKQLSRFRQEFGQIETFVAENEKLIQHARQQQNKLQKQIQQYQEQANDLKTRAAAKTNGVPAETARNQLEQHLEALEKQRNDAQQQFLKARNEVTKTEAAWQDLSQSLETAKQKFKTARKKYQAEITDAGFGSMEKHQGALRTREWQKKQEKALESFRQQLFSLAQEVAKQRKEFEAEPFDETKLALARQQENELSAIIQQLNTERGTLTEKLKQQQENLERYQRIEAEWQGAKKNFERWQKLYELIGANRLRDYALKSMFDLLIQFANHQMRKLSGRYKLKVKDMKDMVVVDTWNASEERPVETLSGGESFLTSLALALALSELSKGRAQLSSLFLDEGFGSLDMDTLELALDALESLRLSGRRVGVISHVQELTRRIPVRIVLSRQGDGSSAVKVKGMI